MSYYANIDELPLFNWKKCQEGKKEYTRKNIEEGNEIGDYQAWTDIYSSYLEAFGISRQYKEYLSKQSAYIRALLRFAQSGDDFDKNDIRIIRIELDLLEKQFESKDNSTLDDAIVYVSKWLGGGFIDENKTTVKQFYTAYNKMIEHGKEN